MHKPPIAPALTALVAAMLLSACIGGGRPGHNRLPPFIVDGSTSVRHYDGVADDLLTAGLGQSGLQGAAPAYADALAPTAAELRRNAIYNNYRALVDFTTSGGFGRLFGPAIGADGALLPNDGKIAGTEYIAYADDGSGRQNVTLMVQVPDGFDPANACIVSATSSGSRGIYGAIGTAGEWGLKRGCAVAYTDKGSGNGVHDLAGDRVTRIDGVLVAAATAGRSAHFRADLSAAELAAHNATHPHRVAYKHAHSQQNPERDWGRNTLQAIEFAFYVLNEQFSRGDTGRGAASARKARPITPANTLVIASSVSNGAGAALAAAEQDRTGLIDGVAVSEPNVQPRRVDGLTIRQGDHTAATIGRPLIDYFTFANLYQPCAILADDAGLSLLPAFWPDAFTAAAQNRCTGLAEKGLVSGATLAAQAADALARLHGYGWQPEHDFLHQSHYRFATTSIAVTYVNALGRFSVADKVCGFSFANTDAAGRVVPQQPALLAGLFASGNGIPPTSGVNLVYDDALGGARLDFLAASPSTGRADFALDGALCLRALATGRDPVTGGTPAGDLRAQADRVHDGLAEVLLEAKPTGKPTLIVSGRNDTLIPPNHASRAYVGQVLRAAPDAPVRYIEVSNAQHFDTFIAFGPALAYDRRFVPLHHYFGAAMDAMYAHLKDGAPLPASQLVRTTPRTTGEPLAPAHLPAIQATPAAGDRIVLSGDTLLIPD